LLADEHDESMYRELEAFINYKMLGLSHSAQFYDGKMHLNYNLVSQGVVSTEDYIAFLFDGTVHTGESFDDEKNVKL
jgi:hypothetical protein